MNIVKLVLGILAVLIIIGAIFVVAQLYVRGNSPFGNSETTATATIKDHTFHLIVARDEQEKQIGLSERESLDQNTGMLFIFDEPGVYPFWMKNMNFPIDILYIRDNTIVDIYENVEPPQNENETPVIVRPQESVDKVLEINAGLVSEYDIQEGDEVQLSDLEETAEAS